MENSMELPQKIKNWSSLSTPGCITEENENTNSKRYMHPNVDSRIVYNSHDVEAT